MGVWIEGIGDDWLVLRRPGGRVETYTFYSPAELPGLIRKLLADKAPRKTKARAPTLKASLNGAGRPEPRPPRPIPVVSPAEPVPECQDCGACCLPGDPAARHYVALGTDDVERIPKELRTDLVGTTPSGPAMITKKHAGRRACQAFDGQVGSSCSCSIYNNRPQACQVFMRGSAACAQARALLGVRVPG